ncbi:hypothetical protein BKA82DRAFT_995827 [Pisolithus tinctorius]|uniref:RING-type domain-containing protein n=1 Tax=Pisolithus tinctorius Marx 270 TaxID=870435 RepID=A0A0C3JL57_PISTI|nr:hypothetical protein BKA82DRAFT_995827 [Pisolithus tinctorius]KIO09833.1 hypothetical protein M404DRAFT_995827 [Pisolithus tinctorius Marx 270]
MTLLNYVEPPNNNLVCCICHAPFTDPTTTRTCMHTFCRDCIVEAVSHSPQCPIDRLPLSVDDLSPANPIVKHLVEELLVECPQRIAGCTYTCQRQLLASHLQNACLYVTVPCPEDDCDLSIFRKNLGKHADVCIHRSTQCQGCGVSVKYGDLNDHYSECSSKMATCSLCAAEFPRSETQLHTACCPTVEVPCVHVDNGCPWNGPRCELLTIHVPMCPYEAIKGFFTIHAAKTSMFMTENVTLKKRVQALEGVVQTMQRDMQRMKNILRPWYQFETQQWNRELATQVPAGSDGNQSMIEILASRDITGRVELRSMSPSDVAPPPVHPADVDDAAAYFSIAREAGFVDAHHHTAATRRPFGNLSDGHTQVHQRSLLVPIAPLNLSTSLEGTLSGLRDSVAAISASVESMARRNDIVHTTESMRINEELGSLRYAIHGIRLQLHRLMMDRNGQLSRLPGDSAPSFPAVGITPIGPSLPSQSVHPPMMPPSFPGAPGTKL